MSSLPATDAASSASAVTLQGVVKSFANGVHALGPIDLKIGAGEFVSLLGPSGCGKSTALRLIAGLTQPTAGRVQLATTQHARRSIGFVFQEPTLMPWTSVWNNVYLPLRLQGRSRTDAAATIDEALASVGLSDFSHVYPRELSGGMKMRVSLARALVTDPDILLMDEPFAALDEITRFRLNNDLIELWRRARRTIVFVTHSVFESVYLSQRVVVMTPRPGRVAEQFLIEAPELRGEEFRTSPGYVAHCRSVSAALARASERKVA